MLFVKHVNVYYVFVKMTEGKSNPVCSFQFPVSSHVYAATPL